MTFTLPRRLCPEAVETEGRRTSWVRMVVRDREGGIHERSAAPCGHAERRVRPDVGRDARRLERRGPVVRGLGDLPRQRVTGRFGPAVRLPVNRVAWAGRPAL